MPLTYPFTEEESRAAADAWGCNCGPTALAFALQVKLDVVRPAIPDFESKRYTSPSMMKAALAHLGATWTDQEVRPRTPRCVTNWFHDAPSLVRIQWTGPWTAPDANPTWAYRYTHWICAWRVDNYALVFDVNGGVRKIDSWAIEIVPVLTGLYPRSDGGWWPTHVWTIRGDRRAA